MWSRPCTALINVNTGGLDTSIPQTHHSTAATLTFFTLLPRQRARKVKGDCLKPGLLRMARNRKKAVFALFEQGWGHHLMMTK